MLSGWAGLGSGRDESNNLIPVSRLLIIGENPNPNPYLVNSDIIHQNRDGFGWILTSMNFLVMSKHID